MGRQYGAVELKGKVGDLQFGRNSDGSAGVKRARVSNRQKIMKGKNYARTRDNMSEFKGSTMAASALRKALGPRVRLFGDSQLQSRLVGLTYGILQNGPGTGGQRTFEAQTNMAEFVGLELHNTETLRGRFQATYTVSANSGRNTATLDVPSFDPDYLLSAPSGTTDFRLILVVGVMSDYTYTGNRNKYSASNPGLAGASTLVESALMPINTPTPAVQLVAALPGTPTLPAGAVLLVSLGIEFYRTINTQSQVLASGNAMAVVAAY